MVRSSSGSICSRSGGRLWQDLEEEDEIDPYSVQEIKALTEEASKNRNSARWAIALALGLRQGEALGLKWADVDLKAGVLRVRRSRNRPKSSMAARRDRAAVSLVSTRNGSWHGLRRLTPTNLGQTLHRGCCKRLRHHARPDPLTASSYTVEDGLWSFGS